MWVMLIILILMIILYIVILTPYPFVWLLRSHKEELTDKSPQNIKEIKEGLIIRKGIPYPSAYPNATFDFYYDPRQSVRHVIVWIHGGSFIAGTSAGVKNFGPMLAKQGYAVFAMNYAYAPRYPFPVQIKQTDEMLRFAADYMQKEFQMTAAGAFLGGDSAGANIAAGYAAMSANEELADKSGVKVHHTLPLLGLLLCCGPYDFTENVQREEFQQFQKFLKYIGWSYLGHRSWMKREEKILASPLLQVHKNFPPAYICDGKKYSFLWQGKKLAEALKKENIYVKTRFYEDMPHEFQFDYVKYPKEAMQVFDDCITFLHHLTGKEESEC